MNLQHLRAILWLRWRMSANQWRRAGRLNAAITSILVVGAIVASLMLFFIALIGGSIVMLSMPPTPDALMLTWDVIVFAFLVHWMMGLIVELQRAELLSLDRLLHLPLSLSSAFILNYASSLLSLPVLVFLPGMLGLSIACVVAYGLPMLTILPLLASFFLFVTAVTYQFRGWLATLMENKRRRKTIIVVVTMAFILMFQLPQLFNFACMGRSSRENTQRTQEYTQAIGALTRQFKAGEISVEEYNRQMAVWNDRTIQELISVQPNGSRDEANGRLLQKVAANAVLGNKVVPFGWFPYGVRAAAMGSVVPGVLASVVLFGVGGLSLWRSYVSTMRFYTGVRRAPKRAAHKVKAATTRQLSNCLEPQIPFLSEHVAAIALLSFRSLLRAPESKMALLSPLILTFVFGGMLLGPGRTLREQNIDWLPPFIAIGIMGVMLFGLGQLMLNIFGADRSGFRAFVLMPVSRRDVLFGKNISVAPLAGCIVIVLIVALQFVFGMRVTHLLATLVQLVPSYLILCLMGNTASILAPMAIASGSLKPAQPLAWPILVQMFIMMFSPIALLPAVAALGAETILAQTTNVRWLPIYLVFSLLEAGVVIWMYRAVIQSQGDWLQRREPHILEILSKVPE